MGLWVIIAHFLTYWSISSKAAPSNRNSKAQQSMNPTNQRVKFGHKILAPLGLLLTWQEQATSYGLEYKATTLQTWRNNTKNRQKGSVQNKPFRGQHTTFGTNVILPSLIYHLFKSELIPYWMEKCCWVVWLLSIRCFAEVQSKQVHCQQ